MTRQRLCLAPPHADVSPTKHPELRTDDINQPVQEKPADNGAGHNGAFDGRAASKEGAAPHTGGEGALTRFVIKMCIETTRRIKRKRASVRTEAHLNTRCQSP